MTMTRLAEKHAVITCKRHYIDPRWCYCRPIVYAWH